MEDYYTKIPSDLLEALIVIPLSEYEHKIFWLILRKTFSYKKQKDWISYKQIMEYTGITKKQNVYRAIKSLVLKNIITKEGKLLGIQEDFVKWVPLQKNDIKTINDRKQKVISTDYQENKKSSLQITKVISKDYQSNPSRLPTDNIITDKTITDNKYIYNPVDPVNDFFTKEKNKELINQIGEIISYLNSKSDKNFRSNNKNTIKDIKAKLSDGYTIADFKKVIDIKTSQWKNTEYDKYLRPKTLFGNKFEDYLNEKIIKGDEHGKPKKHFTNERDYTDDERRIIEEKFYS
ncbi:MAG: conserved phage C-terminal domain-containing protein [Actinobacteria bacterium]|nr:conserved phage C-terminal domain-containing protein [Actinomycetota bacterium]